jgi:hypothetical protein
MIPETEKIIEKFILGDLEGKELDEFHLKMKKSTEFALEVKIDQEIINSILEHDIMDLRKNLKDICSNPKKKPTKQILFDFAQNLSTLPIQNEF